MGASTTDYKAATAAAYEALKRGKLTHARALFDEAVIGGRGDPAVWFGLSLVHRALGNLLEEGSALDKILMLDAHHLPALVAKGDLFVKMGDRRAASSYYTAAMKVATGLPSIPPAWQPDLQRIKAVSQEFAVEYEAHLLAALTASGLGARGTERFAQAVDLLLGKKEIYFQQPKYFFFPELPQIQFYHRREFSWVSTLELEFTSIREEMCALLEAGTGFLPYVKREVDRPAFNTRGLLDNADWSALFLVKDGAEVLDNAVRCPRTLAALRDVPLCRIEHRTPSVLLSVLRPGARIPPHHGFMNARLICHLPLVVPSRCGLRVGNQTHIWREGEIVVFDDTIEHEAWNGSDQLRAVLIFDIWRPELSDQERNLVAAMLKAIDQFEGPPRPWSE